MQKNIPIAENHIAVTRPIFYEGMKTIGKNGYQKWIKKLILFLIVLYLIVSIWILNKGGSLFMLAGETLIIVALTLWMAVFLPRSKWKAQYKNMSQYGEIVPNRTVYFYEDHLTVTGNSCKTGDVPYSKITGWQESEHLYILECEDGIRIMVGKDGFVSGDFELIKLHIS